jgi:pyruvate formate lyase activating enzyme
VDLKAFTEDFYKKTCMARLGEVLETLQYLKHETNVWFEITTLLIPGQNDSDKELDEMTGWINENLGPDVPLHFSAFHPDWKMRDIHATPGSTLTRARNIAIKNGIRYVYVGNVHDKSGSSTYCHECGQILIGRDWYVLSDWNLKDHGHCTNCGTRCLGTFDNLPGSWGSRRQPVRLSSL